MNSSRPFPRRVLAGSPFNVPTEALQAQHFEVDDRVSHDRHGLGRVVDVEGDDLMVVDFGSGIRQRIAMNSAKVHKL